MGMIYKRGQVFWIKCYVNGRPVRESSESQKEGVAKSLLKEREGRAVYHIVSPTDLKAASQKLTGTIPGTLDLSESKRIDAEFASMQ
ncbi:MAG TPA: hypothetical protein VN638_00895 [Nitrospiraceae bacterium]|jgi:hypothetical protein|nr:hypothetical protein [Nitrospiraceae bacterium]